MRICPVSKVSWLTPRLETSHNEKFPLMVVSYATKARVWWGFVALRRRLLLLDIHGKLVWSAESNPFHMVLKGLMSRLVRNKLPVLNGKMSNGEKKKKLKCKSSNFLQGWDWMNNSVIWKKTTHNRNIKWKLILQIKGAASATNQWLHTLQGYWYVTTKQQIALLLLVYHSPSASKQRILPRMSSGSSLFMSIFLS